MAETFTSTFGWTKPEVGASIDAWGGYINADLDGIDGAVRSVVNDNKIINGDFRIDQRNNGATGTAIGYTVDRWVFAPNLATKGTWGRNLNAVAGPTGFPYYLGFQSNSAYAVLTGDYFRFTQPIEADFVSDFAWGTASGQPVTLSFWAYSSLTGTFGGSIQNYAGTRSYPFTYSIPVANTWTKIIVAIPGDTGGTWVMSGNVGAIWANFGLGVGATYVAAAGAWTNGNYLSATGAVSVVATLNATFYVTGVKLEIGSVATPYNRQSLAKSMADCQRYYQVLGPGTTMGMQGYAPVAATPFSSTIGYSAMRANPTAAIVGAWSTANAGTATLFPGFQTIMTQVVPPAIGAFSWFPSNATGFISLSAEL